MIEHLGTLIGYVGTLAGVFTSVYLFRRARRAEVHSKEIATADQMIDLVKKANAEALGLNRKENEKLRQSIRRLEVALSKIGNCEYRALCPVTNELQNPADSQKHGPPAE